ncbi:hypothetical protein L226DRAFT_224496 [Lentinus tigrinus ALCF2SS1-7]|uniref:uncharacterized protein n=1 Tax=Lentinus tigrinus ALCF2SS1-7 TaxID=1328758 RepID=UPI001165DD63|nr:hypothetical protein L226DRAFT_224496 [Lentinus tigrinus ALCF2SS1-7]
MRTNMSRAVDGRKKRRETEPVSRRARHYLSPPPRHRGQTRTNSATPVRVTLSRITPCPVQLGSRVAIFTLCLTGACIRPPRPDHPGISDSRRGILPSVVDIWHHLPRSRGRPPPHHHSRFPSFPSSPQPRRGFRMHARSLLSHTPVGARLSSATSIEQV